MVATDVLSLLHVPPEVAEARAVLLPAQKASVPVIAAGVDCTVTVTFLRQPPPKV
jgi:hypothetical protein